MTEQQILKQLEGEYKKETKHNLCTDRSIWEHAVRSTLRLLRSQGILLKGDDIKSDFKSLLSTYDVSVNIDTSVHTGETDFSFLTVDGFPVLEMESNTIGMNFDHTDIITEPIG